MSSNRISMDNTLKFTFTNTGTHDNVAMSNYYNSSQDSDLRSGYSTYANNVSSFGAAWPQAAVDIMNQAGVEPTYHSLTSVISRGSNLAISGTASATSLYSAATAAGSAKPQCAVTG